MKMYISIVFGYHSKFKIVVGFILNFEDARLKSTSIIFLSFSPAGVLDMGHFVPNLLHELHLTTFLVNNVSPNLQAK